MISLKRKISNVAGTKSIASATKDTYQINTTFVKSIVEKINNLAIANSSSQSICTELKREARWLEIWLNNIIASIPGAEGKEIISKSHQLILEHSSEIEYMDCDDCTVDIHSDQLLSKTELQIKNRLALSKGNSIGAINTFRFYERANSKIIVLDYRQIMDCIALYYGYRELGITVEQIENVLEDCSSAIINPFDKLGKVLQYGLADYKSPESEAKTLVNKTNNNGELYRLIASLRISTNCFQIIRTTNQVETWQHHKINLTPKTTYQTVLRTSQQESMTDIVAGAILEIENNNALKNTKILSVDNCCIALSMPNDIENTIVHSSFDIILRLFNRQFAIPCTIYTYNKETDELILEEV